MGWGARITIPTPSMGDAWRAAALEIVVQIVVQIVVEIVVVVAGTTTWVE